jgi:hypothetical protein
VLRRAALLALAAALASCNKAQPCPEPLHECNGSCVDVQTDPRYCGACDRPCRAGEVCRGGACTPDVRAPCALRSGGAFVTLAAGGACPGVVKLWATRREFIDEAVKNVGSTATGRTPVLTILSGADCDLQWSWQVNDADPSFQTTVAVSGCDVCPSVIQGNPAGYSFLPGKWCPSAARILAVDPQ